MVDLRLLCRGGGGGGWPDDAAKCYFWSTEKQESTIFAQGVGCITCSSLPSLQKSSVFVGGGMCPSPFTFSWGGGGVSLLPWICQWYCCIQTYRVAQKERNSRYSRFSGLCSNQQLLSSLCWIEHLFPIIITSRSSNLVENFLFYETFLMDCHFHDLPDFQSFEARWQINGKSQKWQSIRNYS